MPEDAIALPDDIEQFLLDDQRERAIEELIKRFATPRVVALLLARRWLADRRQESGLSANDTILPWAIGWFGRNGND